MIGLFLLYFIGKMFYELAHEHDRSRWGFAILGVVSYYAGSLVIGSLIIGVLTGMGYLAFLKNVSNIVSGLLTMPLGILAAVITYKVLKLQWEKAPARNNDSLDNDLIR